MRRAPRRAADALITPFVMLRYVVLGTYVGLSTVAAFVIW